LLFLINCTSCENPDKQIVITQSPLMEASSNMESNNTEINYSSQTMNSSKTESPSEAQVALEFSETFSSILNQKIDKISLRYGPPDNSGPFITTDTQLINQIVSVLKAVKFTAVPGYGLTGLGQYLTFYSGNKGYTIGYWGYLLTTEANKNFNFEIQGDIDYQTKFANQMDSLLRELMTES